MCHGDISTNNRQLFSPPIVSCLHRSTSKRYSKYIHMYHCVRSTLYKLVLTSLFTFSLKIVCLSILLSCLTGLYFCGLNVTKQVFVRCHCLKRDIWITYACAYYAKQWKSYFVGFFEFIQLFKLEIRLEVNVNML